MKCVWREERWAHLGVLGGSEGNLLAHRHRLDLWRQGGRAATLQCNKLRACHTQASERVVRESSDAGRMTN